MRLAVISDIHANVQALQAVLHAITRQDVDRIVCLGDIVGYNANPAECIALVRDAGMACVAGNHDRAIAGQLPIAGFSGRAARAIEWTRRKLSVGDLSFLASLPSELQIDDCLVAVHGTLDPLEQRETLHMHTVENRRPSFLALGARASTPGVCAFGHTHKTGIYEFHAGEERVLSTEEAVMGSNALYLINPGTVGQPRTSEKRATFMVLDSARRTVRVLYAAYDNGAVARSTRAAGLGPRLPFVPETLRPILARGAQRIGLAGRRSSPLPMPEPSAEFREGGSRPWPAMPRGDCKTTEGNR